MRNSARHGMLMVSLGLAGPLVGMVACDDGAGGIVLPGDTAGKGGAHTGGTAGMALAGEGGQIELGGAAGSTETPSGAKGGSTTGSGGSHVHGSGGTKTGTGGTGNVAGTDAGAAGDDGEPVAGAAGASEGGAGGEIGTGEAGTAAGAVSGTGGVGGIGGISNAGPLANCIYHSDPVVDVAVGGVGGLGGMGGMGGTGGVARSPHGLAVATNAFIGPYLTDLAGMALYIYGADFPGDCNHPPVSNCYDDCAQSWPVFNANERTLPSTLDDAAFGTLDRGDGTHQTTYNGWPLYYYKTDTTANVINGQGKSKTWFAAELVLPNLVVMRGPVSGGGLKFLGDDHGWTLYSVAGDTVGTSTEPAVSNCTGSCLESFTPFGSGDVFPCTSLEPHDVTLFLRGDGVMQAAYKGVPLYYSHNDTRSGDELGVGVLGGALVVAP